MAGGWTLPGCNLPLDGGSFRKTQMSFVKITKLLTCFILFTSTSSKLKFSKKSHEGKISFIRTQKYTNNSLPPLRSKLRAELSLDILMIADFSTYEDEKYSMKNIKFGKEILKLSLAGTLIAYREEDCPLWSSVAGIDLDSLSNSNETFNSTDTLYGNETVVQTSTLEDLESNFNNTDMTLSMDSKEAIDRLTSWIKLHAGYLPKHDHAILITKFDLLAPNGHSATQGMAYVGNICQLGDSSSVVEDIGASATALIAAHELGHSLGAVHDGAGEAPDCDSNDNFLMASAVSGSDRPQLFANSRTMSPCSVNAILNNFK
ncbi:unnamed protein product [Caenorhabditis auriculariae]|uniref:Peptidase M12B domain-containing protein n=1 Tax=Caenorhabditis auriculariae TaxID=2777116 RepID=A0A8S1HAS5_9PELO|nr:unnamed protein product [Caenorhabditis auriculariae]